MRSFKYLDRRFVFIVLTVLFMTVKFAALLLRLLRQ